MAAESGLVIASGSNNSLKSWPVETPKLPELWPDQFLQESLHMKEEAWAQAMVTAY